MQTHWIIDRFENDHAFLIQGEESRRVPVSDLPAGAKEGDALLFEKPATYRLDPDRTAQKRTKAQNRLAALLGREVR